MLPDRVSNPGPLTYESGALPIALRGPAGTSEIEHGLCSCAVDNHLAVMVCAPEQRDNPL